MAHQFANPSGIFGRLITANLLNRSNFKSNQLIFDLLSIMPGSVVLEVGFGGGDLLLKIAKQNDSGTVYGLERSLDMLHRTAKKVRQSENAATIHLSAGVVDSLPFKDNQFDHICSVNTVYFWSDLSKCIAELYRVTRFGGVLLLGFGDASVLKAEGYEERGFILYTPERIRGSLIQNGFTPEQEHCMSRGKRGDFYAFKFKKT
ncbi:MAG: class I SAM-dependent methyltransferase [bacterium]